MNGAKRRRGSPLKQYGIVQQGEWPSGADHHMAFQSSSLDRITSRLASLSRRNVAVEVARRARDQPSPPNHHLILYEYEASPWCRLVREYATILDLQIHIRPCPRQTLFLEGAFDASSRFRPEAMGYLQQYHQTDDLTFPLLVDQTDSTREPVVIIQSYDILNHLWDRYGQNVLTTSEQAPRADQRINSTNIPFPFRFLSLAAPAYFRPWPTCGILQTPSLWNKEENDEVVLYQAEGCPESRLVREVLCTLEVPYLSIPMGNGSSHQLPNNTAKAEIPVLIDGDSVLQGADDCRNYLWNKYRDATNSAVPRWWNLPPKQNIGRAGSFGIGAYTAFVRGSRAFVPKRALE